ncbi:MAG: hypothetical protein WDZ40_03160 [Candidatus Spechtbacterales bacterium]
MEKQKTLPRGARKHIRLEKSRIRREFSGNKERVENISKLYNKFSYYLEKTKNEKPAEKVKNTPQKKTKKSAK